MPIHPPASDSHITAICRSVSESSAECGACANNIDSISLTRVEREPQHRISRLPNWIARYLPWVLKEKAIDVELQPMFEQGQVLRRAAADEADFRQLTQGEMQRISSCTAGWIVSLLALSTTVGGVVYNLFRSPAAGPFNHGNHSAITTWPEFASEPPRAVAVADKNQKKPAIIHAPGNTINILPGKKKKEYQLPRHQADVCGKQKTLDFCERNHAIVGTDINRMIIKVGNELCFCPPPQGLKDEYDILYLPGQIIQNTTSTLAPTQPPHALPKGADGFQVSKRNIPPGHNKITTVAPPKDDVKIVKLFDFSCFEVRENMDAADWLDTIGATFQKPITKMAEEAAVLNAHIKGEACPSAQDTEQLQKITGAIDYALSSILTLLPHSKPLAIVQCIIGPALQLAANDLRGKPVDLQLWQGLNGNIINIFKPAAPTFTATEQASLYGKTNNKGWDYKPDPEIFSRRFIFKDGKKYIKIYQDLYEFHETSDGIPFIIDEDERYRFVQFENETYSWILVDDSVDYNYSAEQKENRDLYTLPDEKFAQFSNIDVDAEDVVTLKIPNKPDIKGVFIDGHFIPIRLGIHKEQLLAATHYLAHPEQRVLYYTPVGWQFETSSATMDQYLRLLLESQDKGEPFLWQDDLKTVIGNEGFSYDTKDNTFIKKDYKYYKVKSTFNKQTATTTHEVEGYAQALVAYENGMLRLKSEENMLFPLRNDYIPVQNEWGHYFRIETQARQYLRQYAMTSGSGPARWLYSGLFLNEDNDVIFIIYGLNYQVRSYGERYVYIKGNADIGHADDIALWLDGDTYIRVRDEKYKEVNEYLQYSNCRIARAPGQSESCLPVMVEKKLHQRLIKYSERNAARNNFISSADLIETSVGELPFLFHDERGKRFYFHYNEVYFDATIIASSDEANPTGLPVLRISGLGDFFNSKNPISDIVMDEKEGHYEVKEVATFIAEKLNIDKQVATVYVENRPMRSEPEISELETFVSEVQASGESYVETNREPIISEVHTLANEWNEVKAALFPRRVIDDNEYIIKIFRLDSPTHTMEAYERVPAFQIKKQFNYINEQIFSTVIDAIRYDSPAWNDIKNYFMEVFGNQNDDFINDVAIAMRKLLQQVKNEFTLDKFFLATVHSHKDNPGSNEHMESLLTAQEQVVGNVAFMPDSYEGRVYINLDKANYVGDGQYYPATDLNSVIMILASHMHGLTSNFVDIDQIAGVFVPIKKAISNMVTKIEHQQLTSGQLANLKEVSRNYLKKVYPYNKKTENLLDTKKMTYMIKNDPAYRAHLLLNSANFLTLLTQDIYYQLSMLSNGGVLPRFDRWLNKYAELRTPDVVRKIQPLRRGIWLEKVPETLMRTRDFSGEYYLEEAQKIPEIASAIEQPQGNSAFVSIPLAAFLNQRGFSAIRFRALAIFMSFNDRMPFIHFSVVGQMSGQDYVFDLTARQFIGKYEEFKGPVILPENRWIQKYANLSNNVLIKYADYATLEQAQKIFQPNSRYLVWGPEVYVPGAQMLQRPDWYFSELSTPDTPTISGRKLSGLRGYANPVREAARRSSLMAQSSLTSWDYAISLLENAELLSQEPAANLRDGIRQAVEYQREAVDTPGLVDGLFVRTRVIDSIEKMLRIRQGEVVIFMETDPAHPEKGPRPIHMMTSTGNGRFAGIKNSALNPALGDDKTILAAEQLGKFEDGKFTRRESNTRSDLHILAAYPKDLLISSKTNLRSLASQYPAHFPDGIDIAEKMTELLRVSGTLAAEQAIALQHVLTPMFHVNEISGISGRTVQSLFTAAVKINNNHDLSMLSRGKLVIFSKPASSFSIEHMMYSLGRGNYVMINSVHLDPRLSSKNALIKAESFPDDIFSRHDVYAGELSLNELRVMSLLGPDSRFVVNQSTLTVMAHGAASNVWYMNAIELADVIRGLGLRRNSYISWSQLEHVELNSCFSAYGLLPTGQVLANLLQKKVSAWASLFSPSIRNDPRLAIRRKIFMPKVMRPDTEQRMRNQNLRNFYFWSRLLRHRSRKSRSELNDFETMLKNVISYTNGTTTLDELFTELPEYQEQLYAPREVFSKLDNSTINDAEEFAEQAMDVINLSQYSANLLDNYLSEEV
ncbi:hypothetical protein ACQYRI_02030 [Salmonella enterica]